MSKNYTDETYATLRNCRLLGGGEMDGVRFVRCIPPRGTADRTATALRVIQEVGEDGVCFASNPEFGGDYVRVATTTAAYRLICRMLS